MLPSPALQIGAATDANGRAELPNVPAGPQQVTFSSIGYSTRTRGLRPSADHR
ncbi:MAG: carboxypeptidase regulatory-like domain-containing protein [Hymenobacter sp.]